MTDPNEHSKLTSKGVHQAREFQFDLRWMLLTITLCAILFSWAMPYLQVLDWRHLLRVLSLWGICLSVPCMWIIIQIYRKRAREAQAGRLLLSFSQWEFAIYGRLIGYLVGFMLMVLHLWHLYTVAASELVFASRYPLGLAFFSGLMLGSLLIGGTDLSRVEIFENGLFRLGRYTAWSQVSTISMQSHARMNFILLTQKIGKCSAPQVIPIPARMKERAAQTVAQLRALRAFEGDQR